MQDPSKPLWFDPPEDKKDKPTNKPKKEKFSIFLATPVYGEVSIHYFQACLQFQKYCIAKNIDISIQVMKSSLVTQGRNLCVSSFLDLNYTHLLFVDSDIEFAPESIMKMLKADKDVIAVPYPLKTLQWDKCMDRINRGEIKTAAELQFKGLYTYPMKVPDSKDISIDKEGVIEVTHAPTGCMLIKRSVFDKMIKAYPEKKVEQKSIINGELMKMPHYYNFFDTEHEPETKTYLGEDFAFCKRWKKIGGKCHALVTEKITHVGEHQYRACFADELIKTK